jgi:hypothetical protein
MALLISGCSSSPEADGTVSQATTTTTGSPQMVQALPAPLPAPQSATCDVTRTNAGTPAGVGVYFDRALADNGLSGPTSCSLDDLFENHAWANSTLIEVEWTPGAGMTGGDAWIESTACAGATPVAPCDAPLAHSPTSPLTLKVEGDDFATHGNAAMTIQVAAQGAAAQQAFQVTVTLFANATVDEGFTALGD